MPFNNSKSEAAVLNNAELALQNANNTPAITNALTTFGFMAESLTEGQTLLDTANEKFDFNNQEDQETDVASDTYKNKLSELRSSFRTHRKLAQAALRNEPVTLSNLGIDGRFPSSLSNLFQQGGIFYDNALADVDITTKTALLGLTVEKLTAGQTLLQETINARGEYYREKGESEDATVDKDEALKALEDWMNDFYLVAEIALEDQPQLLEALGIVVKR